MSSSHASSARASIPAVQAARVSRSARASSGSRARAAAEPARARIEALGQVGAVEVADRLQGGGRVGLVERQAQLGSQPVAAHGRRIGGAGQRARVLLDREAQARRVARDAPDARRVVDEGARRAARAAGARARSSSAPSTACSVAVEAEGHRVDGHVAAVQVLVEGARPDVGQRARVRVGLGAGAHEVVARSRRRARARFRSGRGRGPRRPGARRRLRGRPRPRDRARAASRSSSRSRTAPPTRCTPSPGANARSSRAPHGSARSTSRAADASRTAQRYPRGMFPRLRGRWRWLVLGGVCCAVAAGAAVAILLTSQPGDVSHPDVEFTDTQATSPTSTEHKPKATDHPMDDGFAWPDYGYTKARTRYLPLKAPLRPPFVKEWQVSGSQLIEFPPVLCKRSLYLEKNNGALYKISRLTGQGALEGEARLPGRLLAGVRGRQRLRGRARARQGDQGRARDGARRQERPRALVAQAALARGVLAAGGQRPPVLRHRGRHRLRAAGPRRRACAGATRPPARSRAGSRSTRGACSSATTAAACTPSASATARRSGRRRAPARRSA